MKFRGRFPAINNRSEEFHNAVHAPEITHESCVKTDKLEPEYQIGIIFQGLVKSLSISSTSKKAIESTLR